MNNKEKQIEEMAKLYEDYQDLLKNFDNYLFEYRKFADGCIKDKEKETAERDFNAIIKALETKKTSILTHYSIKESVGADIAIRTVRELAKQFGVEIKE